VHVAHHFFEREQHGGDRRIEGRRQRRRRAHRHQRLHAGRREPEPAAQHRRDAAPTCTEGPSRPSAMPLASVIEHMLNLPSTVRRLM
jgi:hypothetical protein